MISDLTSISKFSRLNGKRRWSNRAQKLGISKPILRVHWVNFVCVWVGGGGGEQHNSKDLRFSPGFFTWMLHKKNEIY